MQIRARNKTEAILFDAMKNVCVDNPRFGIAKRWVVEGRAVKMILTKLVNEGKIKGYSFTEIEEESGKKLEFKIEFNRELSVPKAPLPELSKEEIFERASKADKKIDLCSLNEKEERKILNYFYILTKYITRRDIENGFVKTYLDREIFKNFDCKYFKSFTYDGRTFIVFTDAGKILFEKILRPLGVFSYMDKCYDDRYLDECVCIKKINVYEFMSLIKTLIQEDNTPTSQATPTEQATPTAQANATAQATPTTAQATPTEQDMPMAQANATEQAANDTAGSKVRQKVHMPRGLISNPLTIMGIAIRKNQRWKTKATRYRYDTT